MTSPSTLALAATLLLLVAACAAAPADVTRSKLSPISGNNFPGGINGGNGGNGGYRGRGGDSSRHSASNSVGFVRSHTAPSPLRHRRSFVTSPLEDVTRSKRSPISGHNFPGGIYSGNGGNGGFGGRGGDSRGHSASNSVGFVATRRSHTAPSPLRLRRSIVTSPLEDVTRSKRSPISGHNFPGGINGGNGGNGGIGGRGGDSSGHSASNSVGSSRSHTAPALAPSPARLRRSVETSPLEDVTRSKRSPINRPVFNSVLNGGYGAQGGFRGYGGYGGHSGGHVGSLAGSTLTNSGLSFAPGANISG